MICSNCAHANDCVMFQFPGTEPPITACYKFKEKRQTNADRIRAKTDEELAEWLVMVERRVIENALSKPFYYTDKQLKSDWLDWLKQEVDDGD